MHTCMCMQSYTNLSIYEKWFSDFIYSWSSLKYWQYLYPSTHDYINYWLYFFFQNLRALNRFLEIFFQFARETEHGWLFPPRFWYIWGVVLHFGLFYSRRPKVQSSFCVSSKSQFDFPASDIFYEHYKFPFVKRK